MNSIVVTNLSKKFRLYHPERPSTLQEAILGRLGRLRPVEYLWALRDVNFCVESGRMVGVIGPNGAGKSTLLRLIGGVGLPDEGTIKVQGRIGALLDLTGGFHPDLTGRENVFISGVIAGLTRREVSDRFDSIVAFAELEEFIDSPVRTFSTGMLMRLGFAVAVHVEPEILLIDEVLAVGDLSFQLKCHNRINKYKSEGCTIILVSHDVTTIREICDDALWLSEGKVMAYESANVVVNQYVAEVEVETRKRTPASWPVLFTPTGTELRVNENRLGSLELEITRVSLLDQQFIQVSELKSGDPLQIEIEYFASQPIYSPNLTVTIRREDGLVCFETSTSTAELNYPTIHCKGHLLLNLERVDLNGGLYYVDIAAYNRDWTYTYDSHWDAYPLIIRSAGSSNGIIRPPHRWEFRGEQKPRANFSVKKSP